MTGAARIKIAVLVALVVSLLIALYKPAAVGGGVHWSAFLAFAFGLVNLGVPVRGAELPRGLVVAAAIIVLVAGNEVAQGILIFGVFLWIPMLLIAYAMTRDPLPDQPVVDLAAADNELMAGTGAAAGGAMMSRRALSAILVSAAAAALAFRGLMFHNLYQTAGLFIGLPVLIGLVVILMMSPHTTTGVICKGITVALCISLLFLGEGFLCIAMAAPLFYGIGVLAGGTADALERRRRRKNTSRGTLLSCVVVIALAPMSLEGVIPATTVARGESVSATRVVRATPAEVARALLREPRFDRQLPRYLRAGFPQPIATRIEGDAAPARWAITIRGGETRLNGTEPKTGTLALQLERATERSVEWRVISDDSHTTHFLNWRESRVEWTPLDADHTRVTWTVHYDRGLDPAWYFGPWERYAARLAAGYLIDAVAAP